MFPARPSKTQSLQTRSDLKPGSYVELAQSDENQSFIGRVISVETNSGAHLVKAHMMFDGEDIGAQRLFLQSGRVIPYNQNRGFMACHLAAKAVLGLVCGQRYFDKKKHGGEKQARKGITDVAAVASAVSEPR